MSMLSVSVSPMRSMGFSVSTPTSPLGRRASSPRLPPSEEGHEDAEEPFSYTRRSEFYASAIPFAWEEKPGTPKAGHRLSAVLAGGSSSFDLRCGGAEFEFSARFSEVPASPTPMLCPSMAASPELFPFGHQLIPPLRPPPRLENPRQIAHACSSSAALSASAPQSPRSPGKFLLRKALCGVPEVVPDPFSAAIEAMSSEDNIPAKPSGGHRRAFSSSPLKMFRWDAGLSFKTLGSDAEVALRSAIEQEKGECEQKCVKPVRPRLSSTLRNWARRGLFRHRRRAGGEGSSSGSSVLVYTAHDSSAVSQHEDNPKLRTTSSSCSSSSSSVSSDFSSFAASVKSSSPPQEEVCVLPNKTSIRGCLKLSFKRSSTANFSKNLQFAP